MQHIADEIHPAPTVEGVEKVLLPGDREWRLREEAEAHGMVLPADVIAKHQELVKLTGVKASWL